MIRRSNENIAASEVESVIREVEDAAAVAVRDVMRGEEVKIYVQGQDTEFDRDARIAKAAMAVPVLVDLRNVYRAEQVRAKGFIYADVGCVLAAQESEEAETAA